MQVQCAQSPGTVVGLRAPPVTGHRQHCMILSSAPLAISSHALRSTLGWRFTYLSVMTSATPLLCNVRPATCRCTTDPAQAF